MPDDYWSVQKRIIPATEKAPENARRRCCCWSKCFHRRLIPWASLIALIITWTGLFLFCAKVYFGLLDMETLASGFFSVFIYYLRMVREGIVILGFIMAALTGAMVMVGFFATLHCERSYRGHISSCVCLVMGSRFLCGLFLFFGYVLNICWLLILMLLVLATSAYFCFLPICLPQAGAADQYCFNFTVIATAIGGKNAASTVSLILCGTAIDKFCKLTRAISVWYWGAYGGCIAVIIGLVHFNGALAANFAHIRHALRYRKIRKRTKSTIEWTKDWRIKSLSVSSKLNTDTSTISTVTDDVFPMRNGSSNRKRSDSVVCESRSSYAGSEPDGLMGEQYDLFKPAVRKTANGSIIVKRKMNDVSIRPVDYAPPIYAHPVQDTTEVLV